MEFTPIKLKESTLRKEAKNNFKRDKGIYKHTLNVHKLNPYENSIFLFCGSKLDSYNDYTLNKKEKLDKGILYKGNSSSMRLQQQEQ